MCLSIKSDFEKCLCISLVIFKVLYHEHFAQQLHVNILVVVNGLLVLNKNYNINTKYRKNIEIYKNILYIQF
jgi:hypothetical protein